MAARDSSLTIPPAATGLTRRRDAFVDAYVANGGNGAAAARVAGYALSCARVKASLLIRDPAIIGEIRRRTILALGAAAPKALATLIKLSGQANSERVRREASSDILDRLGFKAPAKINHQLDAGLKVVIDLS